MNEVQQQLIGLGACQEAVDWCEGKTLSVAWHDCDRADWMFWLLAKMVGKDSWPSAQQICLAGIACGRLSLAYAGDLGSTLSHVFDVAEMCAQNPTKENISAAENAASAAQSAARSVESAAKSAAESAWSAAANAARSAAESAWSAARSAATAKSAAENAAWSAAKSAARSAKSAAWSAESAAWSAAWNTALSKMAGIVRRLLTIPASLHFLTSAERHSA